MINLSGFSQYYRRGQTFRSGCHERSGRIVNQMRFIGELSHNGFAPMTIQSVYPVNKSFARLRRDFRLIASLVALALACALGLGLGVAVADPTSAPAPQTDAAGVLGVAPAPGTQPGGPQFVVRQLADLQFGRVVADPMMGGTVTISPQGGRTVAGGAQPLGGEAGPAEFEVTGAPGSTFVIELPDRADMGQGGSALILTHFTSSPDRSSTIPEGGRATVFVGATLNLVPRVQSGRYQASYDIRIANP
jgi:hypothetical protein